MSDNETENTDHTDRAENELHKNKAIIAGLTTILNEIIEENIIKFTNESTESKNKTETFSAKKIPGISLENYLTRILKYSNIEESTLIISLIYLDRICEKSMVKLSKLNIHRLLITSILVAIKFNEDDYFSNQHYAKVGGITIDELNTLEENFIDALEWETWVYVDIYEKYNIYLQNYTKK